MSLQVPDVVDDLRHIQNGVADDCDADAVDCDFHFMFLLYIAVKRPTGHRRDM